MVPEGPFGFPSSSLARGSRAPGGDSRVCGNGYRVHLRQQLTRTWDSAQLREEELLEKFQFFFPFFGGDGFFVAGPR